MAGKRPFVSFQEIKDKVSLIDVLQVLGLLDRFKISHNGTRLSGICPLPQHPHGPSPNPEQFKAYIGEEKYFLWKCFGD